MGDIKEKIENEPDSLLELNGFGPKALEQLSENIAAAREAFEAANR